MKSNFKTFLIPIAFICKITFIRFILRISGNMNLARLSYVCGVYSLKHLPLLYLPALPALCYAYALDIGAIRRESIAFYD